MLVCTKYPNDEHAVSCIKLVNIKIRVKIRDTENILLVTMQKFLVGGAVRDELLSLPVHERDWVVVGSTPEHMLELGYRQVGKDFPVFLHPETNEEHALARTERKTASGHRGFEVFSSPEITLEQDLQRRDLTINAIAQNEQGELIDPYGGQRDIQQRILRHVSPAFSEDPLRVLRVARFAARFWALGFTINADTLALMASISRSGELENLSKERIWQETQRALTSDHPEIFILVLMQINALGHLIPGLDSALERKSVLLNLSHLKHIEDYSHRYACLVLLASEQDNSFSSELASQINNSFACPKELQELAMLITQHFMACCHALESTSEDIYSILHDLDAFRRPARCVNIIECMKSAQNIYNTCSTKSLSFLIQLIADLNSLSISQQDASGLNGKEIGEAIKRMRIEKIAASLNAII